MLHQDVQFHSTVAVVISMELCGYIRRAVSLIWDYLLCAGLLAQHRLCDRPCSGVCPSVCLR